MNLFSASRLFGSIAVCIMGSYCMHLTNGGTGIGWAILGLAIIWGTCFSSGTKKRTTDRKRTGDL